MLLIKNVNIPYSNSWIKRDVVIDRGIFRAVGEPGVFHHAEKTGNILGSLHGEGKYLIPALIDPHVHVREPGYAYKEDWETCSKAALRGGFTAIFDMPNNRVPITDFASLNEKKKIALQKSLVNFGLYIALTDENVNIIAETTFQNTLCGIKIYLTSTTGDCIVSSEEALLQVFNQPSPVLVHTGGVEGLNKILFFYKKASGTFVHIPVLYLCHTSTREEVRIIRQWKLKFRSIIAEVCPHHLFLNADTYSGYKRVLPPLALQEDIDALWEGIEGGIIDIMGTDHAPHTIEEKKLEHPPAGFPGLETALPLLFSAYKEGRMSLKSFIRLTSGKAGELFRLGNRRGIHEGDDASCVIIEEKEYAMGEEGYSTKCGWSPFNGWKMRWKPVTTMVNGYPAYENGKFHKITVRYLCS